MGLLHTVVCYINPLGSMRQFSGPRAPPPTSVLAHVYGMQNLYTGFIRILAAYNIDNAPLYHLAILTYVGTIFLNGSETLIWKTARFYETKYAYLPALIGLVWLVAQRDWYLP
ncbi:hypothetical protein PV08_07151 [Exophiala spinifera]|uniref:Ergosterol biosynthesis protein Erg28 n=1 Tax=Exophiala spinifera TaxID=91928 RepID=A0A0D2BSW1_9EURO|nr:uncharacterized protein PV08_07151 [Exophiala spinifera]KIW14369.1 hypothetical protein PV08_07151 [Exophiala spinifera]